MNGEAKHTPGPYMREGTTIYALTETTDHRGRWIMVNRFTARVESGCDCTDEEAIAVSGLFAASPDLLQALTELTQSASELLSQVPRSVAAKNAEILRADVDKALEVIARAKGETP